MATMTEKDKLSALQLVHTKLVNLEAQASKLYSSLEGSPVDDNLIRLQNSISNLLDEIEASTWRVARTIQDLEFDQHRTADFEGGY